MVPLINRITDFQPLADVLETLEIGNSVVLNSVLNRDGMNWESSLQLFEDKAKAAQSAYETYSERLRSGDPRIRSAAESTTKPELRAARDVLDSEVGNLRRGTKIIPLVGPAIDIVSAGIDVASGGSASSAVVGLAGGAAGTAVGGLVLSGPPGWVAIGLAAIGAAAAWGSQWAWESGVPLDVREAIDAGDFDYAFK